MNASISPEVLGRIAVQDINQRLNLRSELLFGMRDRLKCFTRMNGRLTAEESKDWLCCVAECMGNDLREIAKAVKEDIVCDLEGVKYEAPDPRDD